MIMNASEVFVTTPKILLDDINIIRSRWEKRMPIKLSLRCKVEERFVFGEIYVEADNSGKMKYSPPGKA